MYNNEDVARGREVYRASCPMYNRGETGEKKKER